MKSIFLKVALASSMLFFGLNSFVPVNNSSLVQEVWLETNAFRKTKGLSELELREELNAIALQHSENMAKGHVAFGHSGFEKRNSQALKSISNIKGFAENVAFGHQTGKDAVEKWKISAGHRQNMLGKFKYIGIGIAKDKQGRMYYTQVFGG